MGSSALCLTPRCERERIPAVNGNQHAHCQACETRLLGEAFGPVSWQDRALTNTLPPMVTGGTPLDPPLTAASQVPLGAAVVSSAPPSRLAATGPRAG